MTDKLDSWKEIAYFLKRGVRTVQRWERTENLPVRRHSHLKRGTVFALKHEIEEWEKTSQVTHPVEQIQKSRVPSILADSEPLPLRESNLAQLCVLARENAARARLCGRRQFPPCMLPWIPGQAIPAERVFKGWSDTVPRPQIR